MKVALFISCYVNELYPDVAMASLELLEGYGLEVEYPLAQTCCGQPLVNNGDLKGACQAEGLRLHCCTIGQLRGAHQKACHTSIKV